MSPIYIDAEDRAEELRTALDTTRSVAVDCEAAGFHRYSDRLCLVQVSTPEKTFIVDPLAFNVGPFLRPALEDPAVNTLMHGAAYDLRLLQRDADITLRGLFDTQVAASLTGEPGVGLQALLSKYLDVSVSKKYQRADWAKRPLTAEMIDYAANDTCHLHSLVNRLEARLAETGRASWAEEEFRMLETSATADQEPVDPPDPVTRVKGARSLEPKEISSLRALLAWRDDVARRLDRAPFRVSSDGALLDVAKAQVTSLSQIGDVKGMSSRFVDQFGEDLLRRLQAVEAMPASDHQPYPRGEGGSPRPTPEVEARFERLKRVRNRYAEELGLDRGRMIANHLLMVIATNVPDSESDLHEVVDLRQWQIGLMGADLLAAVKTGS